MRLSIRPDAAHPAGGYATLTVEGGTDLGADVTVSVFDVYSGRHLGENGWQAEKVSFGPYAVAGTPQGPTVVIGPEIVNQLEEYTALRFDIGGQTFDASWPDDVIQDPGAALAGGILVAERPDHDPRPEPTVVLAGRDRAMPEPPSEPDPEPPTSPPLPAAPPDPVTGTATDDTETGQSRTGLIVVALALLLAVALGGWWFMTQDPSAPLPDERVAETPTTPTQAEPAPVTASADPCDTADLETLRGLAFAQADALMRQCGATLGAETALTFVTAAAAGGEAAALLLVGKLYDPAADDPDLEGAMGIQLGDTPSNAARYYSDAAAAGSEDAAGLLASVCERLAGMTDTLSSSAHEDYCQ